MKFQLKSSFKPTGDQPAAIKSLREGINKNCKEQVLLGVTGSGKTYTLANVIEKIQKPTLVISHNKTLAAQLFQEFRDFFPENAVSYFVSYYDFYQPEAYIPQTDTYIEKETEINEEIDKLRLAATTNLLTRKDTIIVASVSCIYNIGSPKEYGNFVLDLRKDLKISRESILTRLIHLQYNRNNYHFSRGTFRLRGETIDIFPAYLDEALRVNIIDNKLVKLVKLDPISGRENGEIDSTVIYPAKHYMTNPKSHDEVFAEIRKDLNKRTKELKNQGKALEAHRLNQKVNYDLEMIAEIGYVNGIENYSRYFDGRKQTEAPFTLLDYFREPYGNDWLLFIDESHMTVPQIRGMYNGDRSRKQTLIDFGFRLPAALDNRPLTFLEFMQRVPQVIYVSATPSDWEISRASLVAEQLIRPTGIVDPEIVIRPTSNQIIDLTQEIIGRVAKKERVLVTTLTKKMAEELSNYLKEKRGLKTHYLHADIVTLERSDILDDLRAGKYDVVIGINLLREGLDLPEVSLVAILDADKEGFLRSETSLIQTMGRAARHINGQVIMYADSITGSMKRAIGEIERRRRIQLDYNKKYHITPQNIIKPIREKLVATEDRKDESPYLYLDERRKTQYRQLLKIDAEQLTPFELSRLVNKLEREMKQAANDLNFELAAEIRDKIRDITNLSNLTN